MTLPVVGVALLIQGVAAASYQSSHSHLRITTVAAKEIIDPFSLGCDMQKVQVDDHNGPHNIFKGI